MLLKLVPVGISDSATQVRAGALECTAGTVAALLVRGRIVVDEDAFGLKIRKLLVAGVEQEQRLAAVADKHESLMRDLKLVHGATSVEPKSQRETTAETLMSIKWAGKPGAREIPQPYRCPTVLF